MQQLQMISHMENTIRSMPSFVQKSLRMVLTWLNNTFGSENSNNRRQSRMEQERKKNNCQLTGATTITAPGLWRGRQSRISDYDNNAHVRLPEWLIRLIGDRYRELE